MAFEGRLVRTDLLAPPVAHNLGEQDDEEFTSDSSASGSDVGDDSETDAELEDGAAPAGVDPVAMIAEVENLEPAFWCAEYQHGVVDLGRGGSRAVDGPLVEPQGGGRVAGAFSVAETPATKADRIRAESNVAPGLSVEERDEILALLVRYEDLFAFSPTDLAIANQPQDHHELLQHRIQLCEGARPCASRPYRKPPRDRRIIEKEVAEMLQAGIIEPACSPWASPVVVVSKPDGGARFCVDYRRLNAITVKDEYPLPRVDDLLSELRGAHRFATLDLFAGFWQLSVAPDSRDFTTFVCHVGSFRFLAMPFGLVNAPATFQRAMSHVLSGLRGVVVYLSDVGVQ